MKNMLILLLVLLSIIGFGQVVQGSIVTESGSPISGVNIYIDGSSIHTESKADGGFELDIKGQKNGALIFKKENYDQNSVAISSILGKKVKVELIRFQEIEEVTIIPYTETAYKTYIQYFLQQFLGYDLENIKIKNQRSLKFSFDKKNQFLKVKAPQTLLIENKKLGYEIKYDLLNFESDFKKKIVSFYGTSFYKSTNSSDKIKVNRMNAFIGNVPHFMRSIYNEDVEKEGFLVNYIVRQKNPKYPTEEELNQLKEYISFVKTSGSVKFPPEMTAISERKAKESEYVMLLTKSKLQISDYVKPKDGNKFLTVEDLLQVNYKKFPYELKKGKIVQSEIPINQSSMIYINGESYQVYPDGNISNVENFLVDGSFSENKLEKMLPSDYVLGD